MPILTNPESISSSLLGVVEAELPEESTTVVFPVLRVGSHIHLFVKGGRGSSSRGLHMHTSLIPNDGVLNDTDQVLASGGTIDQVQRRIPPWKVCAHNGLTFIRKRLV